MKTLRLTAAAALLVVSARVANAQTTLRIGLAEDPDILDPTLARTYVGRIVFASICDKLFDIDEKLNVVPQLALGYEIAADGKAVTIKLRPNVKFHDGETFDADAAKYSLERHMTMAGSFRKPELAAVERVEVVDPLTIRLDLKAPFAPLIAQLTDRAGMMVSPKAARSQATNSDCIRFAPGHTSLSSAYRRIGSSSKNLPITGTRRMSTSIASSICRSTEDTVRLANLKSGGLELIERVLATDIKDIRSDPKLELTTALSLGYMGIDLNVGSGEQCKKLARQLGQGARSARLCHRPRGAQSGRL